MWILAGRGRAKNWSMHLPSPVTRSARRMRADQIDLAKFAVLAINNRLVNMAAGGAFQATGVSPGHPNIGQIFTQETGKQPITSWIGMFHRPAEPGRRRCGTSLPPWASAMATPGAARCRPLGLLLCQLRTSVAAGKLVML